MQRRALVARRQRRGCSPQQNQVLMNEAHRGRVTHQLVEPDHDRRKSLP